METMGKETKELVAVPSIREALWRLLELYSAKVSERTETVKEQDRDYEVRMVEPK